MKTLTFSSVLLVMLFSSEALMSASVPEYYGVYALDAGSLVALGDQTPEAQRRNFSPEVNILIFDKIVGAAGFDIDSVQIVQRCLFRNQIELVAAMPGGPITEVHVVPQNTYIYGKPILTQAKPASGSQEMVSISSKNPLSSGLYSVSFKKKQYHFSVGLGNTSELTTPLNGALDKWYVTINKKGSS